MLFKLLAEFLGTFFFLSVILATGTAVPIAIALGAAIFFTARVSGGHLNPAVSTMMWVKGDILGTDLVGYISAQILGGLAALAFYKGATA